MAPLLFTETLRSRQLAVPLHIGTEHKPASTAVPLPEATISIVQRVDLPTPSVDILRSSTMSSRTKMTKRYSLGQGFKRLVQGVLLVWLALMVSNFNSSDGDSVRHRPLWAVPLSWLPTLELQESWFLWGDEDAVTKEGLRNVLRSLNSDSDLTTMGRIVASGYIYEQLQQRHCVINSGAVAARSTNRSIEDPIVVIGLPRTGTTFMHGLMGQHTSFRTPLFYEYYHSCGPESNFLKNLQGLKMAFIRFLAPSLTSMHFVESESPEEDILALGQNMVSMVLFTQNYVPGYVSWLKNDSDSKLNASLDYLKTFLEGHLRSNGDMRPWILKTPWHLAQIDLFLAKYKNTRFVWLHRDPVESLSSMVDLSMSLIGIGSDVPKQKELVAQYVIDLWLWVLEKGVDARLALGDKVEFLDLSFTGLNADPVGMAVRAFDRLEYSVATEDRNRMVAFAQENARGKRGVHKPHVKTLGFNAEEVRARYNRIMSKLNGHTNFIDEDVPRAGPTWN